MPSTITSNDLYNILQNAFADGEARIRAAGYTSPVGITVWSGERYGHKGGNLEFKISSGGYSSNGIEVAGRDFWECIGELIRRQDFDQCQKALRLGAPVVDASVAAAIDDEIKY